MNRRRRFYDSRFTSFAQVYALLTAEQKATLAERRQQFEQRGRRGGPRPEDAPEGQ